MDWHSENKIYLSNWRSLKSLSNWVQNPERNLKQYKEMNYYCQKSFYVLPMHTSGQTESLPISKASLEPNFPNLAIFYKVSIIKIELPIKCINPTRSCADRCRVLEWSFYLSTANKTSQGDLRLQNGSHATNCSISAEDIPHVIKLNQS